MVKIKQSGKKEYQVLDEDGAVCGFITESVGFWVIQLGSNTPKACESYERAVTLAEEHCQRQSPV